MMMKRFDFVVVDVDAGVSLAERQAYAAAQQRQVREHWAPAWQGDPTSVVRVATPDSPAQPGEVQVRLLKTPTQDGALGYHDQLPDGTPVIYVFVELAKSYGDAWTSVASHEVLEVLGDPRLRRCVEAGDGTVWDSECCDRVEQSNYLVDGVLLSNFNTPECFEPPPAGTAAYDYLKISSSPNQVLPGGYAQEYRTGAGWTQHGQMSAYRSHLLKMGIGRAARRLARRRPWWRRLLAFVGLGGRA